jgi:hypothetical protein
MKQYYKVPVERSIPLKFSNSYDKKLIKCAKKDYGGKGGGVHSARVDLRLESTLVDFLTE